MVHAAHSSIFLVQSNDIVGRFTSSKNLVLFGVYNTFSKEFSLFESFIACSIETASDKNCIFFNPSPENTHLRCQTILIGIFSDKKSDVSAI